MKRKNVPGDSAATFEEFCYKLTDDKNTLRQRNREELECQAQVRIKQSDAVIDVTFIEIQFPVSEPAKNFYDADLKNDLKNLTIAVHNLQEMIHRWSVHFSGD